MQNEYIRKGDSAFGRESSDSALFSAGDLTYSQDEMNTINPPGIVSGVIVVPEIAGDMKRSIPVEIAEAKHLITASASRHIRS